MRYEELTIEGRNAVMEAFRSGKTIDKLFVLKNCQDGPVNSILREARKHDVIVSFVAKERLDQCGIRKQYENTGLEPCIEEIIKDILCNEGKEKQMLKKIGSAARPEIEDLLEMQVNLQLWVKVKKDWRDSDFLVRNFGYSE